MRWCALLVVGSLLTVVAQPASADGHCDFVGVIEFCETLPDPTPPEEGGGGAAVLYAVNWAAWDWSAIECTTSTADDPLYIAMRFLIYDDGRIVEATDYGLGSGDEVPGAPPQHDGDPAIFAADGLAYDSACVGTGTVDIGSEVSRRLPAFGFGHNPEVDGLVGLETWVWYEGDTAIPVFGMTWTDTLTGIPMELEAHAYITEYVWDFGDGTELTRHDPGSGDNLPATASAKHIYESVGDYTVTVTATWQGEYRIRPVGGTWPATWTLITNNPTPNESLPYVVRQIRAVPVGP